MKKNAALTFVLSCAFALAAPLSAEKAAVWVELASPIYGLVSNAPRIIGGTSIPFRNIRSALDFRLLLEWSSLSENQYAQVKIDGLYRWYALGVSGYGGVEKSHGLYLAGGVGAGYGYLKGKNAFSVFAIGPLAEAGFRLTPPAIPIFVEPYVGYSLTVGPRMGAVNGWNAASGANAGIRFGVSF